MGLASGSPLQLIESAVSGANWQSFFDKIVSSDEVSRGKPAGDVYLETCDRLCVRPDQTVVLEDSAAGIQAGKTAGARVVAVPNRELPPTDDELALADITIESLIAIESVLQRLSPGTGYCKS